jgi:anti-sigma factor RsiW
MTVPEERLLAYVDGLLSPEESAEIDRQLADDTDARKIVEKLKASALPNAEAVETLIPVPNLTNIKAIIDSHTAPPK